MAHRLLIHSFIACSLVGCTSTGGFELPIHLAEQRVEGNPLGGLLGGVFDVPIPLDVDLASETAARDTGPAQRVRLSELSIAVTPTAEPTGDDDDFDFIDSVEIFVESSEAGSSLPRVRVAQVDPVPEGARQVDFVTDPDVNLLPYIQQGARLTSTASGQLPPDDVTFDGEVVLSVEVL